MTKAQLEAQLCLLVAACERALDKGWPPLPLSVVLAAREAAQAVGADAPLLAAYRVPGADR